MFYTKTLKNIGRKIKRIWQDKANRYALFAALGTALLTGLIFSAGFFGISLSLSAIYLSVGLSALAAASTTYLLTRLCQYIHKNVTKPYKNLINQWANKKQIPLNQKVNETCDSIQEMSESFSTLFEGAAKRTVVTRFINYIQGDKNNASTTTPPPQKSTRPKSTTTQNILV